uniref:Deoxynucleoside monophosphate kinase n=1 Tax=Clandestinovirus TaxID=2831644 RepID=A0A8F8KT53_9VIRU|nr:deoxynucleoside monophosphate kinase [Clandestinovirus]
MDQITIFGFLGKKRTGKDTSVQFVREYFESMGLKTCVLRFAHPLKCLLAQMTGQPYSLFDSDDTKEKVLSSDLVESMYQHCIKFDPMSWKEATTFYNTESMDKISKVIMEFVDLFGQKIEQSIKLTPRWMLQTLGTDHLRDKFSNIIWVEFLEQDMKKIQANPETKVDVVLIPDIRLKTEVTMLMNYPKACLIRILRPSIQQINKDQLHISETELDDFTAPNLKEVQNDDTKNVLKERLLNAVRLFGY